MAESCGSGAPSRAKLTLPATTFPRGKEDFLWRIRKINSNSSTRRIPMHASKVVSCEYRRESPMFCSGKDQGDKRFLLVDGHMSMRMGKIKLTWTSGVGKTQESILRVMRVSMSVGPVVHIWLTAVCSYISIPLYENAFGVIRNHVVRKRLSRVLDNEKRRLSAKGSDSQRRRRLLEQCADLCIFRWCG